MTKPNGYCQHDAGILLDDKLSPIARQKFINEVKQELAVGSIGVSVPGMPCLPQVPPILRADLLDLENETKFPEFHKNGVGLYEKIALKLDAYSSYKFLPICDPISLAGGLGIDPPPSIKFPFEFPVYGLTLPMLAIKLELEPAQLLPKLPPTLPQLEIPLPPIPDPRFFSIPPTTFFEFYEFNIPLLPPPGPGLIKASIDIIGSLKPPDLFDLVTKMDLTVICEPVNKLFGFTNPDITPGKATTWLATKKVLVKKTIECMLIYIIGTSLGSSPVGLTGGLGGVFGYKPPPATSPKKNPRPIAVKAAKSVKDTSASKDLKEKESVDPAELNLKYTSFLVPQEICDDEGGIGLQGKAHTKIMNYDAGPLFARAVAFRAGCSDDYFTKKLPDSGASNSKLQEIAKSKNAIKQISSSEFVSLKEGDIIVCKSGTSLVSIDSYDGKFSGEIDCIFAGLPDKDNNNAKTSIKRIDVKPSKSGERYYVIYDDVKYEIDFVIDIELIAKSDA